MIWVIYNELSRVGWVGGCNWVDGFCGCFVCNFWLKGMDSWWHGKLRSSD